MSAGDDTTPPADGVALIAAERRRQIEAEGWTAEHDVQHTERELLRAAAVYTRVRRRDFWPWAGEPKLSHDEVRDFTMAGALIAAEIDRLLAHSTGAAAGPRAGDTTPDDECLCDDCNPEVIRLRAEVDRLRSGAAALERQRDHLQGQLDIIHDAEYSRNDALRRENARLRDAGNPLAHTVVEMLTGPVPEPGDWWHRLAPLADAWWSAAGTPTTDGGEHQ